MVLEPVALVLLFVFIDKYDQDRTRLLKSSNSSIAANTVQVDVLRVLSVICSAVSV